MNHIFTFVLEKQSRVLAIVLIAIAALLIVYLTRFNSLASRYMVYLFVAPISFVFIFNMKNNVLKASIPFFLLIFIEVTLISRIPLISIPINNINPTFVSTGITLAFAIVVLLSRIYKYENLYLPLSYKTLWLVFFISLFISIIFGSQMGVDYLAVNINEFVTFYLEYLLFFYLGYLAFKHIEDVDKFINVLILFGLIAAIGHLFSITTGIQIGAIRGDEIVNHDLDLVGRNWRYGGFFGNPNTMCAYYIMVLPACFFRLIKGKNLFNTAISGIAFLVMFTSLFFSGSRAGVVFLAMNLFFSLFFLKIKLKNLVSLLFGIFIIMLIINLVFDQFLVEYVERTIYTYTKKGTDSPRWLIWPITIEIILDNPLGIGVSTYNYVVMLNAYGNMYWANPHSIYLELLTQTGFAGFIAFMVIVFRIIISGVKTFRNSIDEKQKEVIALLVLMVIGFLLMGITEPIFRNQYKLNHLFGFIIGVILSIAIRNKFENLNNKLQWKNETVIQVKRQTNYN